MRSMLAVHVYCTALVVRATRTANIDIFFSQGAFDISSVGVVIAARLLHKKSVVRYASDNEFTRLEHYLGGPILSSIVRRANAHIANGPSVYTVMRNRYGLPQQKCLLIPNGVAPPESVNRSFEAHDFLGLPTSSMLLVNVGGFYAKKCQNLLVKAWPRIRAAHPAAHLVCVGSGPLLADCRALASQLGVLDAVHFVGHSSTVEMFLRSADVFVAPSISEGCSNALLEAMAHALPCAAADIPANRALITDRQDGLLFAPSHVDDLHDKVVALLDNPDRRRSLGASARRTVQQRFAIDDIAARYLDEFSRLAST